MMTYEEALGFIHGATRVGARDGFARMERMLEILGNPHHKLKFIHVAGTNGKGSTATMTASVLRFTPSNRIMTPEIKAKRSAVPRSGSMKMSAMGSRIAPNRGSNSFRPLF